MPTITKGKTEEVDKTILHVEMTGDPSPCPSCGSSEVVGFGKRPQSVTDIPDNGKPVLLQVITRRFRCKSCGRSFYEGVEGVGSNRRMTDRLADWIKKEAPSRRFTEIAAESGVSEGTIRALLRANGNYERRKKK